MQRYNIWSNSEQAYCPSFLLEKNLLKDFLLHAKQVKFFHKISDRRFLPALYWWFTERQTQETEMRVEMRMYDVYTRDKCETVTVHTIKHYRRSRITAPLILKADSHIACCAHAVPLPCRALIHTCHAAPLPCSNSAVSFVKVRVVAGNIRTASPTV
jgi:hypothetical protein